MKLSGDLSRVVIASERLTLRSWDPDDAAESFAEGNAEIARFMSWNPPTSGQELEAATETWLRDMRAGEDLQLTIRLSETGEFIGRSGLHAAEGTLLETGIWIKPSAQRSGYGSETVAAVIKWGSERFRPSGFLYPVVDENTPSCRLAEKLGGEVIGTRQRQKPGDVMRRMLLYRIPSV
ncbi:MAG: GNAT family N-acetyltransferase [Alphaproteobacteria bacterium]|nr:GNAT family N-acetyltransferase [Alphaproteobacteria bacterium]